MRWLTQWTFKALKIVIPPVPHTPLVLSVIVLVHLLISSLCLLLPLLSPCCSPSHLFFPPSTSRSSSDLSSKKKHCVIYGKWTECMWSVDPQAYEAHKKSEKKGDNKKQKNVRAKTECCDVRSFNLKLSLCISLKH